MPTCPACGRENPDGFQFCGFCGAELTDQPAPAPHEERKVVTVLFCDLVGFTQRAEQMDPEDVSALLSPYHERVRSQLERHGGTVEKFIGDAVMALFGAPRAHEDDPERAVRAALAIRDWAQEEDEVQVRVAVTTGEALIHLDARPEAGEGMASGDVVNTAARLQAAAPVNGILVDETTYRATRDAIDFDGTESVEAKGKAERIAVWVATSAHSRFGVDVTHHVRAGLVGRERELAALREAFERARQERTPQLVTLVGVPGIGKSRLVYELQKIADADPELVTWRQGRCLAYGDGVAFWALAEVVKAQAGIDERDAEEEAGAKLHAAVAEAIADEKDTRWVESHLRPLVGLETETGLGGDRRGEAFAAWRRFLEALAEKRPLVLVLEDLHWADEGLLDFVDELVDWLSGVPLLVVCSARPEILERRPGWGGGKLNASTISLSPLSSEETAVLLSYLLERTLLPAETQQALLERAEGNPLYAEQFAELYLERGSTDELPLPETLQGIVAARLDGLSTEEKAVLQDASVVGKVFWTGALRRDEELAGPLLHSLARKGFLTRQRRSSVESEGEWAFAHMLLRDVAYGQIPRAERSLKHRETAEWIETLGRPEDHAELLAFHWRSALELARASGTASDELVELARLALREAGDRAMALNAFGAAVRSYRPALELSPVDDSGRPLLLLAFGTALAVGEESGDEELAEAASLLAELGDCEHAAEAEILLADAAWRTSQRDSAYAHLEHAVDLVAAIPSSAAKARVLSEVSRYHMLGGRDEQAIEVGRQALEMATRLGLDEIRAHALTNIGTSRMALAELEGIADLEKSIEIATALRSPESLRAYNNLFASYVGLGILDRAAEAVHAGLAQAERFQTTGAIVRWLRFERIHVAYWQGRWEEALELYEENLTEVGPVHALSRWAFEMRGRIRLARNDIEGALEDAEASLSIARDAKDPQTFHPALSFAALAASEAGRKRDAERLADELLALEPANHVISHHAAPLFDLAWVLARLERSQELVEATEQATIRTRHVEAAGALARGEYVRAADMYAEMGSRTNEAYTRLRAAAQLSSGDRQRDAQLERALAFWRSVNASRHVREGEAIAASLKIEPTQRNTAM
jgi:class 3 adenylate cyclase/tetratricopeptide (TPR) repeat protein